MSSKKNDKQPDKSCKYLKKILRIISFGKIKDDKAKIAVLRLSGIIGSAGSFKKGLSLSELNEDIEKAFDISGLKAVALQVNSPGGSPVQSELICSRIRALSEEKEIPVFTFVEDVAASGGYWLACAGDEIYASASSILGSIGVISSGFGFVETIKKLGIERRVHTQGENKSILDPFKEENPKDIEILKSIQKEIHDAFKNLVRDRRNGKIKKTMEKQLFSGEFWTGVKAKEYGLIDDIGDMHSVIKAKFGDNIKYEKISKPKSWIKRKFGVMSSSFIDGCVEAIASQSIWGRFGL